MQAHALAILAVVKADPSVNWTVGKMAAEIAGQTITIGDNEEILPKARALDTRLKNMFDQGPVFLADAGCSIVLVDQGVKGNAGANIHYFKIENVTIDEE